MSAGISGSDTSSSLRRFTVFASLCIGEPHACNPILHEAGTRVRKPETQLSGPVFGRDADFPALDPRLQPVL